MLSTIHDVPLSVPWIGTNRSIRVYHFGKRSCGPKIYLQAGLHADEPSGMLILHHLIKLLEARDDEPCGEIIIVPCSNPVGLAQRMQGYQAGRSDLGIGGNFNRNFPDVSALLGERLAALKNGGRAIDEATVRLALKELVETLVPKTELESLKKSLLGLAIDADYVLDLHSDDDSGVYAFVSNPEHPATDLLSRHIGSVVTVGGLNGGLAFKDSCFLPWRVAQDFFPEASRTGCLAATLEYRGTRDVRDDLAIEDAKGLIGFMESAGILHPTEPWTTQATPFNTSRDCVDYVQASVPGIIVFSTAPGERVSIGEEVAHTLNPA
ncbi:succinylglutamate desuccinylase/aspartoacylase family protein [Ensifer aridi]|uniref:succinylglutamate desuccinylase/aspartoacylase domain-containing protein n=1 Tax=Ensifer aridi TaxID=1708715 RepID=UPI00358EBC51